MKKLTVTLTTTKVDPQRARIMRAVKGQNTAPEMLVRRMIFAMGFRYRIHRADLPGKPDIAFIGRKKVIFVNGCFWHGHECSRGARTPKQNTSYWVQKIARNKFRDQTNQTALISMGWQFMVIWECELKQLESTRERIMEFLTST
ncbi:MAG: very short patch repair endonuclease [Thiobacillus sp.]|nr:very short patch repair endonuclease [Thiobacillus sp.]MDP3125601.1 very short patch repair endonuclease [Thiobacillus sp.]